MKNKIWPPKAPRPVFILCDQCGSWHRKNLPQYIDCRANEHRFNIDELDSHYGPLGWDEIIPKDAQTE